MTGRATPLILVVSGDEAVRRQLVHDIAHRFDADYTVTAAATPDAALSLLQDHASSGAATALVIVDERLGNPPDFLQRVHRLHPQAKRILLIERGYYSSSHPVISVMALGQVDYHLFNPWFPLERILYPGISEFLAAWDTSQDAHNVAVRIVGQPTVGTVARGTRPADQSSGPLLVLRTRHRGRPLDPRRGRRGRRPAAGDDLLFRARS